MLRSTSAVAVLFALCSLVMAAEGEKASPVTKAAPSDTPRIQLAILLDTSNSMDGLINQARTQLWSIVNELATTRRDGKVPNFEVALYEYGKSSLPQSENYLRQILQFTDDLDRVSEELFALNTNGGDEYCGAVIDASVSQLQWSESDKDLKLIFIAGNEPFTQGGINPNAACRLAVTRGITVNTIFCGPEAEGINTGWKEGALLADGSFLAINQDRDVKAVPTPYDDKLNTLSIQLNSTFIVYGDQTLAKEQAARQEEQDSNALSAAPSSSADRASFKASGQYKLKNDLLRDLADKKVKLAELDDEELPRELKSLSPEKRKAYVAKKAEERKALQQQIRDLTTKRKSFLAESRKKEAEASGEQSLDEAILQAVREQAAVKNFKYMQPSTAE